MQPWGCDFIMIGNRKSLPEIFLFNRKQFNLYTSNAN